MNEGIPAMNDSVNDSEKTVERHPRLGRYILALVVLWTSVIAISLLLNLSQSRQKILEMARIQARTSYNEDILYRRWNADHGGVYVEVTDKTQPNPYLSHIPERDIKTPSGKLLTLMNPEYMTRQVYEMEVKQEGVRGHLTSLKPIRPGNSPDPWESKALKALEGGQSEISSIEKMEGRDYMRLMRPFVVETRCLKCHAQQGYKDGRIRGGIAVAVPMKPFWTMMRRRLVTLWAGHVLLWLIGVGTILFGGERLMRSDLERRRVEGERAKLIYDLQKALGEVRALSGLLPICASCKKIRDDKGYWNQIESYISERSEAEFTHGLCPDCTAKLFPELHKEDPGK
jgi:hypothetical protein